MARKPVVYDPNILQAFVEDLYARARSIIRQVAACYALVAALVGGLVVFGVSVRDPNAGSFALTGAVIAGVVGGIVGIEVGRRKAWELKFEAQRLLVFMKIEANTSRVTEPA